MRLLNVTSKTLEPEQFYEPHLPQYAILSHTWGRDEVTFQDIAVPSTARRKQGWQKISAACEKAKLAGHTYIWIDTCCIDKSSSAELSEAINSMFYWYQQAAECYVYLFDFKHGGHLGSALPNCRWFARGWTLQELLAPRNVYLFDDMWSFIGDKKTLRQEISTITDIPPDVLVGDRSLSGYSIAQKMSWASHRETTRMEDTAYCLLGIFGVNMPLLYGERDKAFFRLQEEILKQTFDLTILAWNPANYVSPGEFCGALAPSPFAFRDCGSFEAFAGETCSLSSLPRGLQLNIDVRKLSTRVNDQFQYFIEVGESHTENGWDPVCIYVRMLGPNTWGLVGLAAPQIINLDEYPRSSLKTADIFPSYLVTKAFQVPVPVRRSVYIEHDQGFTVTHARPETLWDDNRALFHYSRECSLYIARFSLEILGRENHLVLLIRKASRENEARDHDAPDCILFNERAFPQQAHSLLEHAKASGGPKLDASLIRSSYKELENLGNEVRTTESRESPGSGKKQVASIRASVSGCKIREDPRISAWSITLFRDWKWE